MAAQVETYSGHKADERPVRFVCDGKTCEVAQILDRWYEPSLACYRVRTHDGTVYLLRHKLDGAAGEDWEITAARPR